MKKVRKRGRIAKKAKSKISNTAEGPIDLVSEEKSKRLGSGKTKKTLDKKQSAGESSKGKSRKEKCKKVLDGSKKRKWKASDEKQVLESPHKKKKRNDWFGIITRTSPYQFFRCISVLKEKQRNAVKQMGFGKLLCFKVDGIPAKLAHFVVDNFRPRKLEIRVPCGKIKIDSEVIQRLLGIPRGGVSFSSLTKLESKDEGVKKWRSRYAGRFVAPTKIVDNIEQSEDEDSFNFRMDFLMCFLTVMVDCHKQGRLRERILDYLTKETNFSGLDWCGYVVEKLRDCKNGWTRCDRGSPFAGPLTILALLYVDNVECEGMKVDYTVNPITFWNMKRLKVRENLEIRNGGFGMGTFKNEHLLEKRLEVEKLLDVTMKNKKKIENALGKLYQEYPENEEVLSLKASYESILEEKPTWPTKQTGEISIAGDEIKSVLKGIQVEDEGGEGSRNEESQDELHDGAEKAYNAGTELGGKPTGEEAFPGNARGRGGEEEVDVDEAEDKAVHDEESDKCHGEWLENIGGIKMEIGPGDVSDEHEGGQKVITEDGLEINGGKVGATTSCVHASESKKGTLEMVVYDGPSVRLGVSQIGIKVGEGTNMAGGGKRNWVWTKAEDTMLVDAMMELHVSGKYVNAEIETEYVHAVLGLMDPNVVYSAKPVKDRMKRMKANFYIVHEMLVGRHVSGFRWDPQNSRVIADDQVWDEYIKTHTYAAQFRNQPFPHYDKLCIIFGEDKATRVQETGVGGEGVVEENQVSPCVESKDLHVDDDADSTHGVQEGVGGHKRKRGEGKGLNDTCVESLKKGKHIDGGDAGSNEANDMMDKVMTQMGELCGLTLHERLIAMSVIGRSAPLAKMFDRLDVDGKFCMAQMVANGSIR